VRKEEKEGRGDRETNLEGAADRHAEAIVWEPLQALLAQNKGAVEEGDNEIEGKEDEDPARGCVVMSWRESSRYGLGVKVLHDPENGAGGEAPRVGAGIGGFPLEDIVAVVVLVEEDGLAGARARHTAESENGRPVGGGSPAVVPIDVSQLEDPVGEGKLCGEPSQVIVPVLVGGVLLVRPNSRGDLIGGRALVQDRRAHIQAVLVLVLLLSILGQPVLTLRAEQRMKGEREGGERRANTRRFW